MLIVHPNGWGTWRTVGRPEASAFGAQSLTHTVYICYVLLCIVMYCYVLYICYTMVYIYIIVSILCYNTCYNICIHICYRCLINIMIIYIYIDWLIDWRFAMNTPNTSGIPQLLRRLAHRAAFLDFLVKSRLEPRNTASWMYRALNGTGEHGTA